MSFNMISNYALQLWVCTNKHLNLYKIEQIDTNVIHDIQHENLCPTCIVTCWNHMSTFSV